MTVNTVVKRRRGHTGYLRKPTVLQANINIMAYSFLEERRSTANPMAVPTPIPTANETLIFPVAIPMATPTPAPIAIPSASPALLLFVQPGFARGVFWSSIYLLLNKNYLINI